MIAERWFGTAGHKLPSMLGVGEESAEFTVMRRDISMSVCRSRARICRRIPQSCKRLRKEFYREV
jgi:hypothetical protein